MIKMSELIKKQNDEIRKETGMVKEENLNRNKKKEVLTKVLKALGIDARELSMYISRVKKGL